MNHDTVMAVLRQGYDPLVQRVRVGSGYYKIIRDGLDTVPSVLHPLRYLGIPITEDQSLAPDMMIFDRGRGW